MSTTNYCRLSRSRLVMQLHRRLTLIIRHEWRLLFYAWARNAGETFVVQAESFLIFERVSLHFILIQVLIYDKLDTVFVIIIQHFLYSIFIALFKTGCCLISNYNFLFELLSELKSLPIFIKNCILSRWWLFWFDNFYIYQRLFL